ncbi:MAG TPA: bifunctional folylpolyglutamate synthase/dihydrofolate synthase [Erysipelotrichaceae bacterium]|nr:folylpolyglutamate synthase/dihydrofolate synthase family protein [Bulleidia sp.]HAW13331.1 bifunctional folylpolyglutamate synthase/dihydrofolate synthase [Erysipelotrichaceae bacterium]
MSEIRFDENWVMRRRNPNHGLEPIRQVLARHGNPQNDLKFIHVAGTNGKGSVCCYIRDVLMAHGYRTGMFTSPHLIHHFDRITIDGKWITKDEYQHILDACIDDIIELNLGMFEIALLIALLHFKKQKTDYVVLECGLGGRLDNTNVIPSPVISVITTIGSDHAALLGNRVQQVAFEKAGIIREHVPVCVGLVSRKARGVIASVANRKHAPITFMKQVQVTGQNAFKYDHDVYELSSAAFYQKENALLALRVLKSIGIDIHDDATKQALHESSWKGRFEKVGTHPAIYLDGAHNKEGIEALVRNYSGLNRPVITVFSALKDKPGRWMASKLSQVSDELIITSINNGRFDSMDSLSIDGAVMVADENQAVDQAVKLAGENGTVVICGSLYFISDIRKRWKTGQD